MPSARIVLASLAGLAALGASSVGILDVGPARAAVGPLPAQTLFEVGGGMLLFVSLGLALSAPRRIGAASVTPAHVAFTRRVSPTEVVPPREPRAPRLPAVPTTDEEREIVALDARVRDLTKRINKASVLFATGRLSKEGYIRHVDDLKRQRSAIESERVHLELKGSR